MEGINVQKAVRGSNIRVPSSSGPGLEIEKINSGPSLNIKKNTGGLTPKNVPMEGLEYLANPMKRTKTPKSFVTNSDSGDDTPVVKSNKKTSGLDLGSFTLKESKKADSDSESGSEAGSGSPDSDSSSDAGPTNNNVDSDSGSGSPASDSGSEESVSVPRAPEESGINFNNNSDTNNESQSNSMWGWLFGQSEPPENNNRYMSFNDIQKEKMNLLAKIERLEQKGYRAARRFTASSDLDEIRDEYRRLRHQATLQGSIQFYRDMTVGVAGGGEMLNNMVGNPLSLKLDGWSQQLQTEVYTKYEYDEIFEELHDKYGGTSSLPAELRLLFMVGGSAAMFHTTKMITESLGGGIADVLRARPDLHAELTRATMQVGAQNAGMNQGNPMMGAINQGLNMNSRPQAPPPPPPPPMRQNPNVRPQGMFGLDPTMAPRGPPPPPPMETRTSRPTSTMRGPQGVDDLLNQINNNPMPNLSSDNRSVMTHGTTMSGRRRRRKDDENTITLDF